MAAIPRNRANPVDEPKKAAPEKAEKPKAKRKPRKKKDAVQK